MAKRTTDPSDGLIGLIVSGVVFIVLLIGYQLFIFVGEHLVWAVVIAAALATFFVVRRIAGSLRQTRLDREAAAAAARSAAEQDAARAADLARLDERQRDAGREYRRNLLRALGSADRLLIDTNVWLDADRHAPLRLLAAVSGEVGRPLEMIGAEFEEVVRLKGSRDPARAAAARAALRLVEELVSAGLLVINRLPTQNVRRAYYDGAVQRLISDELASHSRVTVVTDDTELRIRILGRNERFRPRLTVLTGRELLPDVVPSVAFSQGFGDADNAPVATPSGDAAPTHVGAAGGTPDR